MSYDDLWAASAARAVEALDAGRRDQVEALVREICREPYAVGAPQIEDGPVRDRVAVTGDVSVHFQVDDLGEMVYVVRVERRG